MDLVKKFTIIITGFFSYSIIIAIILNYPGVFFKYIFSELNRLFFITDNNIIRIQYYYLILFFGYQIFIIFFYWICYFQIIPGTTKNIKSGVKRFFINLTFIHIITFIFNQYDFAYFTNNYNFWVESIDFTACIRLYQGFYWDFFFIFFYLQQIFYFIFEKPFYREPGVYSITTKFWSVFYMNIFYRCLFYRRILYFFGGEGFFNDLYLRIFSFFFVEITCLSFYMFFFLLLIKLIVWIVFEK